MRKDFTETFRDRRYQAIRRRLKSLVGSAIPARQRSRIAWRLSLLTIGFTDAQLKTYAVMEALASKAEMDAAMESKLGALDIAGG